MQCGVVSMILRLAVLREHRLLTDIYTADRRTDTRTDTGPQRIGLPR